MMRRCNHPERRGPQAFSLLEMTMVLTLILLAATITQPNHRSKVAQTWFLSLRLLIPQRLVPQSYRPTVCYPLMGVLRHLCDERSRSQTQETAMAGDRDNGQIWPGWGTEIEVDFGF